MKHVNENWDGRRCETCFCWCRDEEKPTGDCRRYPTIIHTREDHFCFEYKAWQAKQFERRDKMVAEGKSIK